MELEIRYIPLEALVPYGKNPRKNEKAVPAVCESIREFGFKIPIIIDAENTIICGHTRALAAKELGINQVPCIVADDLTPEQIRAFRLVDNKVAEIAEWDVDMLSVELADIAADLSAFGFESISEKDFGEEFTLDDGDKKPFQQISLTVHDSQAALIRACIDYVYAHDEVKETFGNENHNGNGVYEVIRQWAAQKKIA